MRSLAFAVAVLLVLPASAAAKSGIGLDGSAPVDLAAGEPWVAVVTAIRHDGPVKLPPSAEPAVAIERQGSGERRRFPARLRSGPKYAARVVFPSPGTWTFRMTGFGPLGAHQEWPPVVVHGAAGPTAGSGAAGGGTGSDGSSSGDSGGFPFGWIAAGSSILIALGLFIERRRRALP